jgi:hypothetical protein
MPALAFLTIVGLVLVALLFAADATLKPVIVTRRSPAVQPCPKVQLDSELVPNENFFSIVGMGEGERRIGHEPRLPHHEVSDTRHDRPDRERARSQQTDTSSAIGTAVPALLAALTALPHNPTVRKNLLILRAWA